MTNWTEAAEKLREGMKDEMPTVQVERVMEILGYSSKSSAHYALYKLQELGVVKWIAGKWYLWKGSE